MHPCWASTPRRCSQRSATRSPRSGIWWRQGLRAWGRRRERFRPQSSDSGKYTRGRRIMPLARSFLYVPANREKFLEKAMGLPSDAFIFDLEDSVPVPEKDNARSGVKAYAPKITGHRVWVRTNGIETGMAEADLDAVIGVKGIAGIFLPKVETRDEVV